MIQNKENNSTQDDQNSFEQGHQLENRSAKDRRKILSEGFTYISTVGWIDRCERIRRKDNPYFSSGRIYVKKEV